MKRPWVLVWFVTACTAAPDTAELTLARDVLSAQPAESLEVAALTRLPALGADSVTWCRDHSNNGVSAELLGSFWASNQQRARFPVEFAVSGKQVRLTEAALPKAAGQNRIYLSRAAFNGAQDSALIEVSVLCGPKCGQSSLDLFVRGPEGWTQSASLDGAIY